MSFWEAILSGIIQGATEFLPISSSGHLTLLHYYFGFRSPLLLFDIFLHTGTLLAIVVYFRIDIYRVLTKERSFLLLILVGIIPTGMIGFLFQGFFREAFVNIKLVGYMFILTSIWLFSGDFASRFRKHDTETEPGLGIGKALIIGVLQGISALPGLSRSGITISAALMAQVRKREAIRFSFLLAIPAIIGALIFEIKSFGSLTAIVPTPQIITGAVVAFSVGLVSIYYLIQAVMKDRLSLFGIYCLIMGIAVLIRVYL